MKFAKSCTGLCKTSCYPVVNGDILGSSAAKVGEFVDIYKSLAVYSDIWSSVLPGVGWCRISVFFMLTVRLKFVRDDENLSTLFCMSFLCLYITHNRQQTRIS